jgi:hypothetical protein
MASPVTVTKSGPGLADLKKALERIRNSDVLVGIPAANSGRQAKAAAISAIEATGKRATGARIKQQIKNYQGQGTATVNNAELMFLFSKGSSLRHQPPRPWLEPAIEASKQIITPHLEAAARAVLGEDPGRAERELKLAGTVAANAAKRWPTDARNGWAENAPSTIRRKGSSRPGIDTGALRAAIVSVVRENGKETDAT